MSRRSAFYRVAFCLSMASVAAAAPGVPSIFYAAKSNDVSVANDYWQHGLAVNIQDEYGMTPLMTASESGSVEMVKWLLRHSADPTTKSNTGATAIQFARDSAVRSELETALADEGPR